MRRLIQSLFLATVSLAACKDSTTAPAYGPPANLLILAGGMAQTGVFGQPVPTAPTVLVTDASNRPVPGVPVTFAITSGGGTLSSASQTTGSNGTATVVWTLGNAFGIKTITATAAGLQPVSFSATAIAPAAGVLAFNLVDPAGDTLLSSTIPRPTAIDLLSLRGDFRSDSLIVTATFSAPVSLASEAANGLGGFLEFDIDDNAATGMPPSSNNFGGTASIRVEYVLIYFAASPTTLILLNQNQQQVQIPAGVVGNTVVARIPMSALGNDDGNFTIAGVFGTNDRPTDIFPNAGQTTVRREFGVTSSLAAPNERQRATPRDRLRSVRWQRPSLTR